MIEITLKRSAIATTPNQRENLRGLGLFRREQTVLRADTPSIRGMIRKVIHLVDVRRGTGGVKNRVSVRADQVEVIAPKGTPEASAAKPKGARKKAVSKKEKAS